MSWPPENADDLERLCADDLLTENHAIDFKRQIGMSQSERKRFAANLASFAIDGGWLIVGFEEHETATPRFAPAPLPLAGQRERVDSIAHTLIDPPLYVTVEELETEPNLGYLLIRIPASPHVLHQVDGRYLGRRDSQKAPLHDGDVQRLIRLRDAHRHSMNDTLAEEQRYAPQVDSETYWTMIVRAEPRTPQLWPLRSFIAEQRADGLPGIVRDADATANRFFEGIRRWPLAETIDLWSHPRLRGTAAASPGVTAMRTLANPDPGRFLELLVLDSGTVQVHYAERHVHTEERYSGFVRDGEVVGLTASLIALAGILASRFGQSGFDGQWAAGLRIDGTHGLTPTSRDSGFTAFPSRSNGYSEARPYVATTTFTTGQALESLADPTSELVVPYLRVLGTEARFRHPQSSEHKDDG